MNNTEWEALVERVGVVAACVVEKDGRYLVVQESPDGRKVWNVPAGHVDKGETLEEAAVRETKEETGYDVRLIKQIALYHESATKSVKHVYEAVVIGGRAKPQEGEIIDVAWLTYSELADIERCGDFRRPWVWDVISRHHAALHSNA
ncbi:NUDIX domain-containing protein [Candidatus Saccharibacteria bacterium]|nr:NUDIX domain-containing protein [Candidatus Saccharibacteria bacterium]